MKPKPVKTLMWALYDEDGNLQLGDYLVGKRPELYMTRIAARDQREDSERVVRVEVTVTPLEGK